MWSSFQVDTKEGARLLEEEEEEKQNSFSQSKDKAFPVLLIRKIESNKTRFEMLDLVFNFSNPLYYIQNIHSFLRWKILLRED